MLTIWAYKIKHSTLGSSFSVTFSVPPTELEYLTKLYDYFDSMNMRSFPTNITADRKTEPQQVTSKLASAEITTVLAYESTKQQVKNRVCGKDINVRSKDEPQSECPCETCANNGDHDGECRDCVFESEVIRWKRPSHYKPKTEPQTKCKTCKWGDVADEHCEICGIAGVDNYEPQTERSE